MSGSVREPAFPLTVVIATLGGDTLGPTVARLNSGRRRPTEILICIPEREASRATPLQAHNARVVVTSVRGQVAQRAEGFRQATQPFVMQLDDDMEIDENDVALLLEKLRQLGPGNAVSPIFVDGETGLGIHRQHGGILGFFQSLNATVLGGLPWGAKRMGRVSRAGTNFGVDRDRVAVDVMQTEWVPGGCVVHHQDGLVLEPFFPFPGKAYCEDLIHSHLLARKGVRLWVVRDATCRTGNYIMPVDARSIIQEARARIHLNRLRDSLNWRFWVWISLSVVLREIRHLLSRRRATS